MRAYAPTEDAMQDAWVMLLEREQRGLRFDNPKGWIYKVACDLTINEFRRQGRERRALGAFLHQHATDRLPELFDGRTRSMRRTLRRRAKRRAEGRPSRDPATRVERERARRERANVARRAKRAAA